MGPDTAPAAAGRLHLVPVPISAEPGPLDAVLPAGTVATARAAHYFLAENARSARAFLKAIGHPQPIAQLRIVQIGHDPEDALVDQWLAPLRPAAGATPQDGVLVSEAGCPGIADPGANIVARAHALGIPVVPWVGPSAIVLALMGAGMNGQAFRFLGYLPQDRGALQARLQQVQADAWHGETQIFIETPYRSARLFESLLQHCDRALRLCVAADLTGSAPLLRTCTIGQWQAQATAAWPPLDRRPAVFLLHGTPAPAGRRWR